MCVCVCVCVCICIYSTDTWAVNSLNTRINKVSTVKVREYTGEALLCKGKTGGNHPNHTHTLTFVDLLQPAIPSSMRVRQMEAECVSVRVDMEALLSLEGFRDDLVGQRLVLVVALGDDVRITKLVDLPEKVLLMFLLVSSPELNYLTKP